MRLRELRAQGRSSRELPGGGRVLLQVQRDNLRLLRRGDGLVRFAGRNVGVGVHARPPVDAVREHQDRGLLLLQLAADHGHATVLLTSGAAKALETPASV
jgi:hypothetical protein